MARLSALFENEADMRLATTSGRWPFDPGQWAEWLSEPGTVPFFLMSDGADVGHFVLRVRGENRHLSWVLIRRSRRGGIGRDLLAQACEAARDLGAQVLTLNVLRSTSSVPELWVRGLVRNG